MSVLTTVFTLYLWFMLHAFNHLTNTETKISTDTLRSLITKFRVKQVWDDLHHFFVLLHQFVGEFTDDLQEGEIGGRGADVVVLIHMDTEHDTFPETQKEAVKLHVSLPSLHYTPNSLFTTLNWRTGLSICLLLCLWLTCAWLPQPHDFWPDPTQRTERTVGIIPTKTINNLLHMRKADILISQSYL